LSQRSVAAFVPFVARFVVCIVVMFLLQGCEDELEERFKKWPGLSRNIVGRWEGE
jgi:hypothetical protein